MSQIYWVAFRVALLILLCSILLGAGLIWHSQFFLEQKKQQLDSAEQALRDIEDLNSSSQEAVDIIQSSYPRYQNLKQQGLLNTEQRLFWINRLHHLQDQLQLAELRFTFSEQQRYALPGLVLDERFQLFVTNMDLNIAVSHSVALLQFLHALEQQQDDLLNIQNCTIDRQRDSQQALQQGGKKQSANIKARCRLQWFTAKIDTETDGDTE